MVGADFQRGDGSFSRAAWIMNAVGPTAQICDLSITAKPLFFTMFGI